MHIRKSHSSSSLRLPVSSLGNSLKKSIDVSLRKQSIKHKNHHNISDNNMHRSSKTVLLLRCDNPINKKQSHKNRISQGIERVGVNFETAETFAGSNQLFTAQKVKSPKQTKRYCQNDELKSIDRRLKNLYEQIDSLQQQISKLQRQLPSTSNNKAKPHQQLLKQYEKILKNIEQFEKEKQKMKIQILQNKNNKKMLQEQQLSKNMQIEDMIAQQQYIEQIVEMYSCDYPVQYQCITQIIKIQDGISKNQHQIAIKQTQIEELSQNLIEFKQITNFQLDQKIIKKKISDIRIKIMKQLQIIDKWAQKHCLCKIREIICMFLSLRGFNHGEHVNDWGLYGLEGWICRNGLLSDWQQYLYKYRNQSNQRYTKQTINQYIQHMHRMNSLLKNTKLQSNQHESTQKTNKIKQLHQDIIKLEQIILRDKQQKQGLIQKLTNQHNNQALAAIEHLNQQQSLLQSSQNKFQQHNLIELDLLSIKKTLKQLKQQQQNRIQKMKSLLNRLMNIGRYQLDSNTIFFMNQKQDIIYRIDQLQIEMKVIDKNINVLNDKKLQIQNKINRIIDDWQQIDRKKAMLKVLYKQLNQTNKQKDSIKLGLFESKTQENLLMKTQSKRKYGPKQQLKLGNTLKQTHQKNSLVKSILLKNKQFNRKNKQNILQIMNNRQTISKVKSTRKLPQEFLINVQQQIGQAITRKPSLLQKKNYQQHKNILASTNKTNRQSLTAMLMSKLTKI